jgi:hypothetical protein
MLLCILDMSDDAKPRDGHNGSKPGADVSLPYDRMTVEQFRIRFPRARWSDSRKAWWVPGKTASRRIGRWLAEREDESPAAGEWWRRAR